LGHIKRAKRRMKRISGRKHVERPKTMKVESGGREQLKFRMGSYRGEEGQFMKL
jgi:hypothetical protein